LKVHTSTGGAKKRVEREKDKPKPPDKNNKRLGCLHTHWKEREKGVTQWFAVSGRRVLRLERESWNRWRVFHQGWSIGSTKIKNETKSRSDFLKFEKKKNSFFSHLLWNSRMIFLFLSPPHTHTHIYNRRLCV
jgi:hypothetical protein